MKLDLERTNFDCILIFILRIVISSPTKLISILRIKISKTKKSFLSELILMDFCTSGRPYAYHFYSNPFVYWIPIPWIMVLFDPANALLTDISNCTYDFKHRGYLGSKICIDDSARSIGAVNTFY